MSTTKLAISDDLSLPIDAATQTFAFIARKGAGKTYAAGKLVELLIDANVQVVILDTVGNWYGLRIAAEKELHPRGGSLGQDLGRLVGRGLVEKSRGQYRAREFLFAGAR